MADEGDIANDLADLEREVRIQGALAERKLPAIGVCHHCKAPLRDEQLFCDSDCSEDYFYIRQRLKANQGVGV